MPPAACATDRDGMDHLGPHLGQQLELKGVHERQEAGARDEVRIRLEDAPDVLEQLAAIRAQRNRQGDRRQVGATAAEGRQLAVGADSLEAGDDRHEAIVERRSQRPRQDAAHLRAQVRGGRADAGLGTRERARRDAATLEPEGEERRPRAPHRWRAPGPSRARGRSRPPGRGPAMIRRGRAGARAPRPGSCRSHPRRR